MFEFRLIRHALYAAAIATLGLAGSAAAEEPPFKIGFVGALSGPGAANADSSLQGAQLAVEEINAKNLAGRKLEMIIADDATDPKTAGEVCSRLVLQDKVDAIVGSQTTPSRLACNQFAGKAGLPYISATVSPGDICIPNMITVGPTANQMNDPLIEYALKQGSKKFYFIGSDFSSPRAAGKLAEATIVAEGGSMAGTSFVPLGASDFTAELGKIAGAKPDVVYSAIVGAENLSFHKQFANDPRLAGIKRIDNFLSPQVARQLGQATAGVYVSASYLPGVSNPISDSFKAALIRRNGDKATPEFWSVLAYDAVYILADAIKSAGTKPDAIIAALKQAKFDGPAGPLAITSNYGTMPMYVGEVEANGTIKVAGQTKPIEPKLTCKFN